MGKNLIDIHKFEKMCKQAMQDALKPYALKYCDLISEQYNQAHPQHKGWGRELGQKVDIISQYGGSTSHVYQIGFQKLKDYEASRAHVIQDGNGEIWTKPGQQVYGDDLKDKHTSTAQFPYRIPDLQHDGQHAVQNGIKKALSKSKQWQENVFFDFIELAAQRIQDCIQE